ncbi:hypothetical protein OIDMADRAFT_17295 [Oidiodendron maius Zn]|uniref:Uncharacterized protein n=1 Tax=Oidiodendron maius (strain Zn) TaxID=913774 RepID=A0A0C3HVX3_OIDMZ|nr:hypothetical protein OIDMADRAFT_17295 [Oidiodendron maius Zn]
MWLRQVAAQNSCMLAEALTLYLNYVVWCLVCQSWMSPLWPLFALALSIVALPAMWSALELPL